MKTLPQKTRIRAENATDLVEPWLVFWPLLASMCAFLAAYDQYTYQTHAAFLNGGLSLVASSFVLLLRRWRTETIKSVDTRLSRLTMGTLISFGFAAFFATHALMTATIFSEQRILAHVGRIMIWKEGVASMTLSLMFAFMILAAICGWRRWSNARFTVAAVITAMIVFLFGPTLTAEIFYAGEIPARQELFFKFSLSRMMKSRNDVFLHVVQGPHDVPEETFICIEKRNHSLLMFGHRFGEKNSLNHDDWRRKRVQQRKTQCDEEIQVALTTGKAIESALYNNQPSLFFARLKADPTTYRERRVAADVAKLPEPLRSRLSLLLPVDRRWNYKPFDVALAVGDHNAIATTFPPIKALLPHQRQALFHLGLAHLLNDSITASQNKDSRTDTTASVEKINATLLGYGLGKTYRTFSGNYSGFDYFMANRRCDLAYAEFLSSRNIQPTSQHILHLLSSIGYGQYPSASAYWSKPGKFFYAHPSLGAPEEHQLGQCIPLAHFYANKVQDFNSSLDAQGKSVYEAIYGIARTAVIEWVYRDGMRRISDHYHRDTRVIGNPALLFDVAAEILKRQPPSFEQYCAWANTANLWLMSVQDRNPKMVAAMAALPERWRQAKLVYRSSQAECNLKGLFTFVNEFETLEAARDFVNISLKRVDIPCQANLTVIEDDDNVSGTQKDLFLRCTAKAIPWQAVPDI